MDIETFKDPFDQFEVSALSAVRTGLSITLRNRTLPAEYTKIPKDMRGQWLYDLAKHVGAGSSYGWKEHRMFTLQYGGREFLAWQRKHSLQAATGKKGSFRATELYLRRSE